MWFTADILNLDNKNRSYKCPEKDCFLTPSVNITKNDNSNFIINCCCRINHSKNNLSINEFLSLSDKRIDNICCNHCELNSNKNKNIRLYYCYQCKKYICNQEKCNNEHETNCKNKILTELEKIDSDCLIHGKNLIYFCQDCNISFCNMCEEHKNHNKSSIKNIFNYNKYKKELITKINNNLKILELIFNDIDKYYKNFLLTYKENKKLLELNILLLDNLSDNEMINGEINKNIENCVFIKKKELKSTLEYYEKSFTSIKNNFVDEFFEFNKKEQEKLLTFFQKIPVIINFKQYYQGIFSGSGYKNLNIIKKFLFPPDTTTSQISFMLRKDMKVGKRECAFLLVNGNTGCDYGLNISEIYEKYKQNDGYLYMTYQIGEAMF